MAEKTLEELTAENAALREFVRVTARVPVKEVWYHGMFATTWKCLSCGYDAGVPGHWSDCRAVQARQLLGSPNRNDDNLKERSNDG